MSRQSIAHARTGQGGLLLPSARRLLLTIGAGVALTTGVAPSEATAAVFGTQESLQGSSAPRVERALTGAQRSGARVFRLEAKWASLEPNAQGERDPGALAQLDRLVSRVTAHGMRTVLVIDGTPCWASAAPAELRGNCDEPAASSFGVTRYRPADPASAVPISTFLVARYAKRLAAFQVWNEPDQANEKYWAGPQKVEAYVDLLRALYKPLKAAAPTVPVLAGSFVGTDGRWLDAMYREGAKGNYDALAVQFYTLPLYGLRKVREIQRAQRDLVPVWLTEFGYTSCLRAGVSRQNDHRCVTKAGQARATADVLAAVRKRPWIAAAIQYDLLDDDPGGYTFGIYSAAGRAKPVLAAVRNVLSGRQRAPRAPTLRLRRTAGRVTLTGTATLTDLITVTARGRNLRYRATLLTDQRGRWRLLLPPQMGTRVSVTVSAGWAGRTSGRS